MAGRLDANGRSSDASHAERAATSRPGGDSGSTGAPRASHAVSPPPASDCRASRAGCGDASRGVAMPLLMPDAEKRGWPVSARKRPVAVAVTGLTSLSWAGTARRSASGEPSGEPKRPMPPQLPPASSAPRTGGAMARAGAACSPLEPLSASPSPSSSSKAQAGSSPPPSPPSALGTTARFRREPCRGDAVGGPSSNGDAAIAAAAAAGSASTRAMLKLALAWPGMRSKSRGGNAAGGNHSLEAVDRALSPQPPPWALDAGWLLSAVFLARGTPGASPPAPPELLARPAAAAAALPARDDGDAAREPARLTRWYGAAALPVPPPTLPASTMTVSCGSTSESTPTA
eukprot:365862-Chlamydomonas_euryale.AAC.3